MYHIKSSNKLVAAYSLHNNISKFRAARRGADVPRHGILRIKCMRLCGYIMYGHIGRNTSTERETSPETVKDPVIEKKPGNKKTA